MRAGSTPARPAPCMFAYCTERLHLSEAEAYLRIAAARASRERPALLAMLADGRLHLAAIAKLAPHLTPDNRDAVLERATHCSKRQVEELAAELAPCPDAPALIRKLPEPPPLAPSPTSGQLRADRIAGSSGELRRDAVAPHWQACLFEPGPASGLSRGGPTAELRPDEAGQVRVAPAAAPAASLQPLAPGPTASSSPQAPGCATSSRGSRPSALLRPRRRPRRRHRRRRHRKAREARGPPLRAHECPPQGPLADRDEARPRATSLPPSAGPCTSETEAVVASSTNRADGARPATISSTTIATPSPWVAITRRRRSHSRGRPTTCTWRRSTSVVRPWPGIGGRAPGRRAPRGKPETRRGEP